MERNIETLKAFEGMQADMQSEYVRLLDFADTFKERQRSERSRLPYQLNVIDELHINENAHSRILLKLLQYQNPKGEYELLQSLLERIGQSHEAFTQIQVAHPLMTQEEKRIDLWVRNQSYALVVENKVYYAADQEAQISRYIETTLRQGYRAEDIFVIYLSQRGDKEPDEQSWGRYKTDFERRYANLSFRNDLYPWLKHEVLPNIRQRDVCLSAAVVQYIDYLEGFFNLRTIEKTMNMNLEKLISEHFALNECKDDFERIQLLKEKKEELAQLTNKMTDMQESMTAAFWQSVNTHWQEEARKQPGLKWDTDENFEKIGVVVEKADNPIRVHVAEEGGRLYCGVLFEPVASIKGTVLEQWKEQDHLFGYLNETEVWSWYGDDMKESYDCFCQAVKRCQELK